LKQSCLVRDSKDTGREVNAFLKYNALDSRIKTATEEGTNRGL